MKAMQDAGLCQLRNVWLRLMRGARAVAVEAMKQNWAQSKVWAMQSRLEAQMMKAKQQIQESGLKERMAEGVAGAIAVLINVQHS